MTNGVRLISPVIWRRIAYFRRTARLAEYLSRNPSQHLTLARASEIACMERTAFSRFFKARIGVRFSDFVRAYRIELATRELAACNRPVKEVAHSVGFNCLKTFERSFKRETGMSPSTFRARRLAAAGLGNGLPPGISVPRQRVASS